MQIYIYTHVYIYTHTCNVLHFQVSCMAKEQPYNFDVALPAYIHVYEYYTIMSAIIKQ